MRNHEGRARDRRVLITGGLGFIGSFIAHDLVRQGAEVTLLDFAARDGSPADLMGLLAEDSVRVVIGDVTDPRTYADLRNDYDCIVHAAGVLGRAVVAEQSRRTMHVNIIGTLRCLEFCAGLQSRPRFILFSTSEIYGHLATEVAEATPSMIPSGGARWCYASSKLAAEHLVQSFVRESGVDAAIVRPFNVYGPHRVGSNAMTTIVGRAIANEPIVIDGDGKQTRAWCYVTDFVSGVLSIMNVPGIAGEAFNLGNDRTSVTMLELAELTVKLLGSRSRIVVTQKHGEDVLLRSPDLSKSRRLLDYSPVVSLEDGIQLVARSLGGRHVALTAEVAAG